MINENKRKIIGVTIKFFILLFLSNPCFAKDCVNFKNLHNYEIAKRYNNLEGIGKICKETKGKFLIFNWKTNYGSNWIVVEPTKPKNQAFADLNYFWEVDDDFLDFQS